MRWQGPCHGGRCCSFCFNHFCLLVNAKVHQKLFATFFWSLIYLDRGTNTDEENQEIHTCETKKYMWNLALFILWEDVLLQTASILPSPALLQFLLPLQQCQPSPLGHNIELAFIKIKKSLLSMFIDTPRSPHWWRVSPWRRPWTLQVDARFLSSWTICSLVEGPSQSKAHTKTKVLR